MRGLRVDANGALRPQIVSLLSPADRLALVAIACHFAITLLGGRRMWPLATVLVAIALLVVVLAQWGARSRTGDVVHAFLAPYAAVGLLFETSGRVAAVVNRSRWDAALLAIDERFFSHVLATWRGLFGRPEWLTALASVAYVSFYFFPAAVGLAMFVRRSRREFDEFAFTTEAAFFLPYVGYLAMPALGPREAMDFGASGVAQAMHGFIQRVELNTFDAFPSGHTTVALVVAWTGVRAFPRWAVPIAAAGMGIVFSTVYLSYHYVVDVVAGVALALAMPLLLPVLRRVCGQAARSTRRPLISSIEMRK